MRGPRRPRTEVAPCKAGSPESGRRLRRQKGWGVSLVREPCPSIRGGRQAYVPGAFSRTVQTGARSPLLTSAGWPASRPPNQAVLGALGQKEGGRGGTRSPELSAPVRTRGWELAATPRTDLESIRGGQLSEHQRRQPAHPGWRGGSHRMSPAELFCPQTYNLSRLGCASRGPVTSAEMPVGSDGAGVAATAPDVPRLRGDTVRVMHETLGWLYVPAPLPSAPWPHPPPGPEHVCWPSRCFKGHVRSRSVGRGWEEAVSREGDPGGEQGWGQGGRRLGGLPCTPCALWRLHREHLCLAHQPADRLGWFTGNF